MSDTRILRRRGEGLGASGDGRILVALARRPLPLATRHLTSLSGITSARGSGPKSSPNLMGGRSWNMKSHFQRSDGFEACSQWRAETGRENTTEDRTPWAGSSG